MKKIIAVIAVSAALAGCSTTEKGAVAGALISGNATGAAVGALMGRVAGQPNQCRYSDGRGGSYVAAC